MESAHRLLLRVLELVLQRRRHLLLPPCDMALVTRPQLLQQLTNATAIYLSPSLLQIKALTAYGAAHDKLLDARGRARQGGEEQGHHLGELQAEGLDLFVFDA